MSRAPDYLLRAMVKTTGVRSGKIGAMWDNADGTRTLVLDPDVRIEQHRDVVLTLFPNDREKAKEPEIPGLSRLPWDQNRHV